MYLTIWDGPFFLKNDHLDFWVEADFFLGGYRSFTFFLHFRGILLIDDWYPTWFRCLCLTISFVYKNIVWIIVVMDVFLVYPFKKVLECVWFLFEIFWLAVYSFQDLLLVFFIVVCTISCFKATQTIWLADSLSISELFCIKSEVLIMSLCFCISFINYYKSQWIKSVKLHNF